MAHSERIELMLRKPRIGWFPKPTVVFNGRGQPAQWGTGTWQVSADGPTEVTVFLFNRLWRFGHAEVIVAAGAQDSLVYSPPILPFGPGRLECVTR